MKTPISIITSIIVALSAAAILSSCAGPAYRADNRQDGRQDHRDDRQDHRDDRQDGRQDHRDDRQDARQDRL